jgi:PTH1 family peptidyl-tRNA hydrolase
VLGLGNPGGRYADTRHNAGFRVAQCLSRRWNCPFSFSEFGAEWGRTVVGDRDVVLARPLTYMNASGEAARSLCERYGVKPGDLLVVCDDVDLPLGRLRVRPWGGAGGHRGLVSVIAELGTDAFARVRVGVGRPPEGTDTADYVLGVFEPEEEETATRVTALAADAVEVVLRKSLESAMAEFNGLSVERQGSRDVEPGGC